MIGYERQAVKGKPGIRTSGIRKPGIRKSGIRKPGIRKSGIEKPGKKAEKEKPAGFIKSSTKGPGTAGLRRILAAFTDMNAISYFG